MKIILGKKIEMTQRFAADGRVVPVTRIQVTPCTVTQVRTQEKDGYVAVQLGCGTAKHPAKPQVGHTQTLGKAFAHFREFRMAGAADAAPGKVVDASAFAPGDIVMVQGTSKGRGFQGVVKRHGFHGHPASHGHKDQLRMPGSIGSKRQGPVAPGKRMAGRMGNDQITVKNLEVIAVDAAAGELVVKGAVPGARGALLAVTAPGALTFVETTQPVVVPEAPLAETAPVSDAAAVQS